jgi:hypothetical protein
MGYYLFAILPNIQTALTVIQIVSVIFTALISTGIVLYYMEDTEEFKVFKTIGKWLYPFLICITLLNIFIPSQKQLAFIIAAPYIVENEDLQQAGKNTGEIIKLGTEYLKDILDDKRTQTVSNGD